MKVIDLLERSTAPLISYEIIPPLRGGSIQAILETVEQLMPFRPPFIDVTSHAAEISYDELTDGSVRRRVRRKRPGTIGLCAAIQGRFGVETVPHLLCGGFTREETEDALIELHYLGIQNVMALRGDSHGTRPPDRRDRTVNAYAADLVGQIKAMNAGCYLEELAGATTTDFCVGVAAYPEKHFEAPNFGWDLLQLKRKVEAGADYIVTQMFFDNRHYFRFVERCRAIGITVPIIPGLKVLSSKRQLRSLPQSFYVEIPEELTDEIEAARPERVADIGVEWTRRQSEELLSAGAPSLHYYIMANAGLISRVVEPLRALA